METTVNATPPAFFAYPEEWDPDARWVVVHARCGRRAGDFASLGAAQEAIARRPVCGWCQEMEQRVAAALRLRERGDF